MPEGHHHGGGTKVAHSLAAMGAQRPALAGVGIGHAAVAIMYLAFATVPLGGVTRMVMTVVLHGRS
ncbi:hypothetical protein GCM10011362_11590 [Marinobacter halophilus]|nr:hypothetical protein GCM10011362_11590 [Marinobacter halophilus]